MTLSQLHKTLAVQPDVLWVAYSAPNAKKDNFMDAVKDAEVVGIKGLSEFDGQGLVLGSTAYLLDLFKPSFEDFIKMIELYLM